MIGRNCSRCKVNLPNLAASHCRSFSIHFLIQCPVPSIKDPAFSSQVTSSLSLSYLPSHCALMQRTIYPAGPVKFTQWQRSAFHWDRQPTTDAAAGVRSGIRYLVSIFPHKLTLSLFPFKIRSAKGGRVLHTTGG